MLTEGEARFLQEIGARGRFRMRAVPLLGVLWLGVITLLDWRAVELALDLSDIYPRVAIWGGVMLAAAAALLVLTCVYMLGRRRSNVVGVGLGLGMAVAGVFGLSGPYYTRAVNALPSRFAGGTPMYEPTPMLTVPGGSAWNLVALAVLTLITVCTLTLVALRTLPAEATLPAELRGIRGVRARVRTARRALVWNPLRLVFGPIFERDVRITGRRRATYVFRAVYPALLLGITAIAYVGTSDSLARQANGRVAELQALQKLAPQLTLTIAWAQFALLMMIAPVLTAPALCEEKRARTLGSLLTTPLSNLQVVLGKLASRMVHVVILVAASTPLLLAARVFGGVDTETIVAVLAITLTSALVAASMGLHFSVVHKRPATAAVAGMLATGAVLLLPASGMAIYALQSSGPPSNALLWGASAPLAMAYVLFDPLAGVAGADQTTVWLVNCGVNLAFTALACLSSAAALRRVMLREVVNEGAALKALTARARRRAAKAAAAGATPGTPGDVPAGAPDAGGSEPASRTVDGVTRSEHTEASRTVSDRPVLWRELRQSTLGSRLKLGIALLGILLCGAFLYSRMEIWEETIHMAVAGIVLAALCLQAAVTSTGTITSERESQSWETLMTTPLTPMQVLLGKFVGSLKRLWLPASVLAIHCIGSTLLGYLHPLATIQVLAIAFSAGAMLCATGLLLSLVVNRSTVAAVGNLGFAGVIWIGAPILTAFALDSFNIGQQTSQDVLGVVVCANPVVLGIFATPGAVSRAAYRFPTPTYQEFIWRDATMLEYGRYVATACIVALAVAAAALAAAHLLFPRKSGRSS
jgi:ABC-type transport system involved in multi-copper enzyme maturation permease subunit